MSGPHLGGAEARALLLGSDLSLSGPVITPAGGALADALRLANAPLATAASQHPGPVRRARVRWRADAASARDDGMRGRGSGSRPSNGGSAESAHPLSPARQGSERPAAFAVSVPARTREAATSGPPQGSRRGVSGAGSALLFGHDVEQGLTRADGSRRDDGRVGDDVVRGPSLPSDGVVAGARPRQPAPRQQFSTHAPPPRRRAASPDPDEMLEASLGRLEAELSRVERPTSANRTAAREAARRAVAATAADGARHARRAGADRRRAHAPQGRAALAAPDAPRAGAPVAAATGERGQAAAAAAAAAARGPAASVPGGPPGQFAGAPDRESDSGARRPAAARRAGETGPGAARRAGLARPTGTGALGSRPRRGPVSAAASPSDAVGPIARRAEALHPAGDGAASAGLAAAGPAEVPHTRSSSNGHRRAASPARPAGPGRSSSAAASGRAAKRRASPRSSGSGRQQLSVPGSASGAVLGTLRGPGRGPSRSRSSSRGRPHSGRADEGPAGATVSAAPTQRGGRPGRAGGRAREDPGTDRRRAAEAARPAAGSTVAHAEAMLGRQGRRAGSGNEREAADEGAGEDASPAEGASKPGRASSTSMVAASTARPGGFIDRREVLVDRAVQRAGLGEAVLEADGSATPASGGGGGVGGGESVADERVAGSYGAARCPHDLRGGSERLDGRAAPAGAGRNKGSAGPAGRGRTTAGGRSGAALDRTERLGGISSLARAVAAEAPSGRALAAPEGATSWGSSSDESDAEAAVLRMARPGATGRLPLHAAGAGSGERRPAGAGRPRGGKPSGGGPESRSEAGRRGASPSDGGPSAERARMSSSIESTGYARAFRRMRRMQGQPVAAAPAEAGTANGGARVRWGSPLAETLRTPEPTATARSGFGAPTADHRSGGAPAAADAGHVTGPLPGREAAPLPQRGAAQAPATRPEDRARRGLQEVIAATREMVARARASTEARRFADGTTDLDFSMGSTWSAESPGDKGGSKDLFSQPAAPGEGPNRAQRQAAARAAPAPVLNALPSRRYARRAADGTASVASSRSARSEVVLRASERRLRSSQALAPETARTRRGPLVSRAVDRSGARVVATRGAPPEPLRPSGQEVAWAAGLGAGGPPRPGSLAGHSAPEARVPPRSRSGSARRYRNDATAPRSTRSRRGVSAATRGDA